MSRPLKNNLMKLSFTFFKPMEGGALRRQSRDISSTASRSNRPTVRPCNRATAGFSLLEVLMAITVLIIIVLIISLVFQQAQNAWGSGTRKAGAETTLRSIMGSIERDLNHAVDAAQFGQVNPSAGSSSTIEFVTLDGTNRVPQIVEYAFVAGDLTRSTYAVSAPPTSPTNWVFSATAATTAILNGSQPLLSCTFTVVPSPTPGLPLRVEIEAHAQKKGSFAIVSGWCEGKNPPGTHGIVVSP